MSLASPHRRVARRGPLVAAVRLTVAARETCGRTAAARAAAAYVTARAARRPHWGKEGCVCIPPL